MQAAPPRDDEAGALAALAALQVLDTAPEAEFDALVQAAALVCGVPISLISLVDSTRQWFKANTGLPGVTQTPRDEAFCAHAVRSDGLMVVPDATLEARFADNPLVQGRPDIRFYAGAPLRLASGHTVGTLCVIDRQPRQLSAQQCQVLQALATAAVAALEGRAALRRLGQLVQAELEAARSLAVAREQVAALSELSPLGVYHADAQGQCVFANARMRAIFGLAADSVLSAGACWSAMVVPRDARRVQWALSRARDGQRDLDLECRIQRPDGTRREVRVMARAIVDAQGQLSGHLGSVEDVTERARQRRRSASLLDAVRTHFIVAVTDTQGQILDVNDAFCTVTGYPRVALLGQDIRLLRSGQHDDSFYDALWQQVLAGKAWRGETSSRTKDGRLLWMDSVLTPLYDDDDRIDRCLVVSSDITQAHRQRAALARSERLLNETGAVAGVGGWALELDGMAVTWSDQTCRLHGVPHGHHPSVDEALQFYPPEARARIAAAVQNAMAHGTDWDLELPLDAADGRALWVRAVGHAERDGGRVVRLLGALQDVTAQVQQRQALQQAHERMALATDSGGIGVWSYDQASGAVWWDAWMCRLYGLAQAQADQCYDAWASRLHPDDRAAAEQALQQALDTGTPLDMEFRITRDDGTVRHIRATGRVRRDRQGQAKGMVGVNWDVTDLRQLAASLAAQHELLRVTLRSIGDAVITTDGAGRVVWLNPVAEQLTGWDSTLAEGLPLVQVFHIVHEETRVRAVNPVQRCLQEGQVVGLANHTLLIARDGREFGIEDSAAPILNDAGDLLGAVLVFRDVSEQRRLSGEMTYRATHDTLTGLVNRGEFETRLQRLLQRAKDDHSAHALLYIDLDQFKLVNDAGGHAVGDQLLLQVGKLLAESVRHRDTLARLGGDEFGIILENCSVLQAERVAQKVCERMDDFRFVHAEQRFRIGTSIGLVPVDERWPHIGAIQKAADTACYAAKEAGRNRVHTWFDSDAAMRARQDAMQWTARITRALDERQFVLHAQRILPLLAAAGGLHAEVLLRMRADDGSLIPPGAFLPAAERFNLIGRIDRWVLREVLDWMRAQPDLQAVEMLSVNLSGQSVGDSAFHAWAMAQLGGVGPSIRARLCLEITETAAVTNLVDAAHFIAQVREAGVKVALDDFGAGASSFGYLKSLPVDCLKIDGRFIRGLVTDPLDEVAVRCFADVARVMGLSTVAEFVDDPAVCARLRAIGIGHAQGFLMHRPEPIDALMALPDAAPAQPYGAVPGGLLLD